MLKKNDVRLGVTVMLGVMAAGFVMFQFRDVGVVAQARSGYGN